MFRVIATALAPLLNRVEGRLGHAPFAAITYSSSYRSTGSSAAFLNPSRVASLALPHQQKSKNQHRSRRTCATSGAFQRHPLRRHCTTGEGRRTAGKVRMLSNTDGSTQEVGMSSVATSADAEHGEQGQWGGLNIDDARGALRSLFGHDDFRDGQVWQWYTVCGIPRLHLSMVLPFSA